MGDDLLAGLRANNGLTIAQDGALTITGALPEAISREAMTLGGQYVIRPRNLHVEVELIEDTSARRSLIYLRDGDIYLFIRPGAYRLRYRFLMRPGQYQDAGLTLTRLDTKAKFDFYAAKLRDVLRRPPSQWLGVLRRLGKPSPGITGAKLETAAVAQAELATRSAHNLDGWTLSNASGVGFYADIAGVLATLPASAKAVIADVDVRQTDGSVRPSLQTGFCFDRWHAGPPADAVLLTRGEIDLTNQIVYHVPLAIGRRETVQAVQVKAKVFAADRDDAVSVIIPTKTHADLLQACVDSLDLSSVTKELIIIDNGATRPDMIACLRDLSMRPSVRVLRHDAPFNFSELCNIGAQAARYPTLLFLNDDIEALDSGWLTAMLAYAARKDVGVVGARLLYPSGDLQHAGIATHLIPGPGHPWRSLPETRWRGHPIIDAPGEVDAVTAACLMIQRDLFQQVGGFDEEAFEVTLNDVDLCLKVRARGLKIMYVPQATLLHKEGQSREADDSATQTARRERELKAFYQRHDVHAHESLFCSANVRRDSDTGEFIF